VLVERFAYDTKRAAADKIRETIGDFDERQDYFVQGPERGYCLGYRVDLAEKKRLPKPAGFNFPRLGWLRVDAKIASSWLHVDSIEDTSVLDSIVPRGSFTERLSEADAKMREVSPARVVSIVSQTIRRDTQIVRALKEVCRFRCQFPQCSAEIAKKDGELYVEVAHIKPVREGGKSILGNLVVLCPNHHKEFDLGDLTIHEQTTDRLCGTLNGKRFDIRLPEARFGKT
jgi:hypothetical protein